MGILFRGGHPRCSEHGYLHGPQVCQQSDDMADSPTELAGPTLTLLVRHPRTKSYAVCVDTNSGEPENERVDPVQESSSEEAPPPEQKRIEPNKTLMLGLPKVSVDPDWLLRGATLLSESWVADQARQAEQIAALVRPALQIQQAFESVESIFSRHDQQIFEIANSWLPAFDRQQLYLGDVARLIKPIEDSYRGIGSLVADTVESASRWFAAQLTPFLEALPDLVDIGRGIFPSNLIEADVELDLNKWTSLMMDEGLPIAWVPQAATIEAIMSAGSASARRSVYGTRWKGILTDCEVQLDGMSSSFADPYVKFAQKAVGALRGGHSEAAQSLAANTLDSVLQKILTGPERRPVLGPDRIDPDDFGNTKYFVYSQLWGIHRPFHGRGGEQVPKTFNRHGSVHGVSRKQFSRLNAVLAVAHLTSVLCYVNLAYSRGIGTGGLEN